MLWTDGVLLIGYFAGPARSPSTIPADKIDSYLLPLVVLIVLISAIPIYIEICRDWRERRAATPPRRRHRSDGRHRADPDHDRAYRSTRRSSSRPNRP